jgi:hypothetical protein
MEVCGSVINTYYIYAYTGELGMGVCQHMYVTCITNRLQLLKVLFHPGSAIDELDKNVTRGKYNKKTAGNYFVSTRQLIFLFQLNKRVSLVIYTVSH